MRVARLLLERGAAPSAEGKNGLTPLHLATHFNNAQVALLLLEHKALPHAAAKNGYTPLHIAAKKNRHEIAINLIEYGADTNAQSRNGFTPLHLACQEGHTDMISLLLQNGATVDFKVRPRGWGGLGRRQSRQYTHSFTGMLAPHINHVTSKTQVSLRIKAKWVVIRQSALHPRQRIHPEFKPAAWLDLLICQFSLAAASGITVVSGNVTRTSLVGNSPLILYKLRFHFNWRKNRETLSFCVAGRLRRQIHWLLNWSRWASFE